MRYWLYRPVAALAFSANIEMYSLLPGSGGGASSMCLVTHMPAHSLSSRSWCWSLV